MKINGKNMGSMPLPNPALRGVKPKKGEEKRG